MKAPFFADWDYEGEQPQLLDASRYGNMHLYALEMEMGHRAFHLLEPYPYEQDLEG